MEDELYWKTGESIAAQFGEGEEYHVGIQANPEYVGALKHTELFGSLSEAELGEVANCVTEHSYNADDLIIREATVGERLYLSLPASWIRRAST